MKIRSSLLPQLVTTGYTLAGTRTYRSSVDAARLEEIRRTLSSSASGHEEKQAQIDKVIQIMDAGDDFQDHAHQPSWAFQFSRRTLDRLNQALERGRTWSLAHGHTQDSVSPEVFVLYERLRHLGMSDPSEWDRELKEIEEDIRELKTQTHSRLERQISRVSKQIGAAAQGLEESQSF
jgi:chromosome segregation ATPase